MDESRKRAAFAILFRVEANPGQRDQLARFLEWDRAVSLEKERGTLCFDVFEDAENTSQFYVYEAYEDAEAFEEHKRNEPYKKWCSADFQRQVILAHVDLKRFRS